jgi:23S rRNA pseudouridine2605 synthase
LKQNKPPVSDVSEALQKRTAPKGTLERVQKVLARMGLGSRREMETWISAGRIHINGELASLGDQVGADDQIKLDGRTLKHEAGKKSERRILIYNKPEGEICSRKDPEGRATVFDQLPKLNNGRWISIGRLDFNTCGLLLFTTDGELANALMHPASQIEREYLCRIMGEVEEQMLIRLTSGVELEDGMARFKAIADGGGTGINHWYSVIVMEGRNREVRRLWESQGLTVSRLKRIRFGSINMPTSLKRGHWQELTEKEVNVVSQFAGLDKVAHKALSPAEIEERKRAKGKRRQWKAKR